MAKKPKALVLDSWAVIAYLEDDPAGEKVGDIMADAQEKAIPIMMTVVNAGEVWYIIAREINAGEADASIKLLADIGIQFVEADWSLTHAAAGFKSRMKMSFADCFAAALAKQRKAHLLTGDPEFRQVQEEVAIIWLTDRSKN